MNRISFIENNDRRNGEIIINGWVIDMTDLDVKGSDKQVAWARDIIKSALVEGIKQVGNAQKALTDGSATSEDLWEAFSPKAEAFVQQVIDALNGADARVIIDNRQLPIGVIVRKAA